MDNKEKAIICFYDSNFAPVLRTVKFNELYDIVGIYSPLGWGLCGKDASYADGGTKLNINIGINFEEYFTKCDTVIFAEPDNYINYEQSVYPRIFSAIENGKNIICLLDVTEKINEIEKKCAEKGVLFKSFIPHLTDYKNISTNNLNENHLDEINTPIIAVLGLSDNTFKFNIQLQIKQNFEEKGYKTTLVGSKRWCEFVEGKPFPDFMLNNSMSEVNKIYYFNKYIKDIELTEKPDVIILGIPGGIMPFNSNVSNDFGFIAFETLQAIQPDFSILSIFRENYTSEYFKLLTNNIKFRYGFELDAFAIANRRIDWMEMTNGKPSKVKYLSIDVKDVINKMDICKTLTNKSIYTTLNQSDSKEMFKTILNKLEEDNFANKI